MSWQHIRGHDHWVKAFTEALRRGRLGHAYLFAGPEGIGKRLFALELAKALLCERSDGALRACDQCASCKLADASNHPDVLRAARPDDSVVFPIDTMRKVLAEMALKPARGGYKILILDNADDFNDESANAFLKTLEEPPPMTLLIVLASDATGQLATIISRCQVIHFQPLSAAAVIQVLTEHGVERIRAEQLTRIAGGSPGLALQLSDDAFWSFREKLLAGLAVPKLDILKLGKEWSSFVDQAGDESGAKRRRAALCVDLLMDLLGAALRQSVNNQSATADSAAASSIAAHLGTDRLLTLLDRCLIAKRQIDRLVQLSLVQEALIDALA